MSFRDQACPRGIEERLDQAAALKTLTCKRTFGMTLTEVADEIEATIGKRPALSKLSNLQNGVRVPRVFGLRETEIGLTFFTTSHIARDAMLMEQKLRETPFDPDQLVPALRRAEDAVHGLRHRLRLTDRLPHEDEAAEDERMLDRAAVDSLDQQIRIYRARLANAGEKKRLFVESLSFGSRVMEVLKDALNRGAARSEPANLILVARVAVNGFYAVYEIDVLSGEASTLPRSRSFARRYGTIGLFNAAFFCADATHDPRVAHHFAELAVLSPRRSGVRRSPVDVREQRASSDPVETAARLLVLSRKLDRQDGTPIGDWRPAWLQAPLPELDAVKTLIA